MDKDTEIIRVLGIIEKPILNYIKQLMKKCGREVSDKEAENLLFNIGMNIITRRGDLKSL